DTRTHARWPRGAVTRQASVLTGLPGKIEGTRTRARFSMADATIRRALISVSDKTGLVDFASALSSHGVELLSTGGTAKALKDAGLAVKDVAEHTGFPEMMDGRLKTLHPKVHGGLLAIRGDAGHDAAAAAHGIAPIDLLAVNLYPFEAAVARG